jgi:hypothetical protein
VVPFSGDRDLAALAVGDSVFGALALSLTQKAGKVKPHVVTALDYVLGGKARPASSLKCEAASLGLRPDFFKQQCIDAGTAAFIGSCIGFSVWASRLASRLEEDLEAVGLFTTVKYDETPLPLNVRDSHNPAGADSTRPSSVTPGALEVPTGRGRCKPGAASSGKLSKQELLDSCPRSVELGRSSSDQHIPSSGVVCVRSAYTSRMQGKP